MKFRRVVYILSIMIFIVPSVFANTITSEYDGVNRLLKTRYPAYPDIQYVYDDNGNRTGRIVQPCIVVSGYVLTQEGFGIESVILNDFPGNPTTDSSGFYSVQVEPGWSGIVTPQKTGYLFTPAERTYNNLTADLSEQNYTGILATITPIPTETPPIPEPTTIAFFVIGLLGLFGLGVRKWKK